MALMCGPECYHTHSKHKIEINKQVQHDLLMFKLVYGLVPWYHGTDTGAGTWPVPHVIQRPIQQYSANFCCIGCPSLYLLALYYTAIQRHSHTAIQQRGQSSAPICTRVSPTRAPTPAARPLWSLNSIPLCKISTQFHPNSTPIR